MLQDTLEQAEPAHIDMLQELLVDLAEARDSEAQVALLLSPHTRHIMALAGPRAQLVRSAQYPLDVERQLAEFAS